MNRLDSSVKINKQNKCAAKNIQYQLTIYKNIMQYTDLKVKMNKHKNNQTYEKYVGNTKKGRHENR